MHTHLAACTHQQSAVSYVNCQRPYPLAGSLLWHSIPHAVVHCWVDRVADVMG